MEIIERNITGAVMNKRVGNVAGVVIHNDASGLSAKQWYNTLVNAPYSRLANGIAHYYIDRYTNWRAIDTFRIGWHTASDVGNNSYIGYEVSESMGANDADFIANEEATFKQAALDLKFYKLPVNRNTVKLHMEFVSTACPHRSMYIHTGFNPVTQGRPNQAIMNQLKDYFIARISHYYNGGTAPKAAPAKAPAKKAPAKATNGWQTNQYGTRWKNEKGTFVNGGEPIQAYFVAPFVNPANKAGKLPAKATVKYDEVMVQDGHVWVAYNANDGKRIYLPIRTHKNGVDGALWGTIK